MSHHTTTDPSTIAATRAGAVLDALDEYIDHVVYRRVTDLTSGEMGASPSVEEQDARVKLHVALYNALR